jgi:SprT protein
MTLYQLAEHLKKYVPIGSELYCAELLLHNKVHLNIKSPRLSKLGDYRPKSAAAPHRISVNRDLNPYAFLITFLHEIAHLTNFEKFENKVAPHGPEWKREFKEVMEPMMAAKVFPFDIFEAVHQYMQNPYASSCSDPKLMKILHKYDMDSEWTMVDEIQLNGRFKLKNGMEFTKLAKKRTRYECRENTSGRMYLVPGISPCKRLT